MTRSPDSLIAQAVRFGQDLDRMLGGPAGALSDLKTGQRTVGGNAIRPHFADLLEDWFSNGHREWKVLLFHAPRAVVPRALLDNDDFRARNQLQEVPRLESDVLNLQVARDLVEDSAGLPREIEREPSFGVA